MLILIPAISFSSDFNKALKVVLQHEGGLSIDRDDPGGVTNFGISLRYLRDQGLDIDGDGDSDENDIFLLKLKDASKIYYHGWWLRYHYDRIQNQALATKCLDLSVNMGAKANHKIIQRAINVILKKHIVVDGILGKQTTYYLNTLDSKVLLFNIRWEAQAYYLRIINHNPILAKYKKGWLKRAAA